MQYIHKISVVHNNSKIQQEQTLIAELQEKHVVMKFLQKL